MGLGAVSFSAGRSNLNLRQPCHLGLTEPFSWPVSTVAQKKKKNRTPPSVKSNGIDRHMHVKRLLRRGKMQRGKDA